MRAIIADYARLLRLPGLGGLSVAPVFGALSVGVTDIYLLILLFLLGACSAIYGFVLNDYIDVKVDKLSKELGNRPLVKGTISQHTAVFICIATFILAFVIIFGWFYTPNISFGIALGFILLSALLGTLYNIYGKRFVGSDILVALSEGFLVLTGAYLVLPQGQLTIFTWIFALLTFNQLLYMNAIMGGLKDADHDYLMNVKNFALSSGVHVTKENTLVVPTVFRVSGLFIRIISIILVFLPFTYFSQTSSPAHLIILLIFSIGVLVLSEKFLSQKTFDRSKLRKLITGQTFLRYSLIPLMLFYLIGFIPVVILIIFPFIWYILFTLLIHEHLFKPVL